MSRRLILMRHAKAVSGAATDHDRPLAEQGREEAQQSAAQIAELNWRPDYVLCSDAQRTQETWEFIAPIIGSETNVRFARQLYNAETDDILELVSETPGTVKTLMIVGHNPGLEALAEHLTGSFVELGTAHAALIHAEDVDWDDVNDSHQAWQLEQVVSP